MFENFGMVCSDCNSLMGIGEVNPESKVQLKTILIFYLFKIPPLGLRGYLGGRTNFLAFQSHLKTLESWENIKIQQPKTIDFTGVT
jgi:hypothetical protein